MSRAVDAALAAVREIDPKLGILPAQRSSVRGLFEPMEGSDYAALALWALDQAGASARVFEEVARAIDREGLLITEAEHTLRCWAYEVSWAAETALDLEGAAQGVS